MSFLRELTLSLICICQFIGSVWASCQTDVKVFSDEHLLFSYSTHRYVTVSSALTEQKGVYEYFLKLKNEDAVDSIVICMGNIKKCSSNTDSIQPYWYSDDGALMLFSATTTVKSRRIASGEMLYEAYPACPATDREGSSAYAGDCYMAVKAERSRTLSITYWIGPAALHRSKVDAAKEAMKILNSIRIK
ncbi:hypothetical protein [Paraburkholderia sp. J7]|uniref:hypothetical protein n=1 Tax=Paraburkholderia sp. J7 TaxID=2805438 RepID=UPI002AB5F19A|nr:hypothetical protein [Paraburkholderia sp. J7]